MVIIFLYSTDWEQLTKFYTETLGFPEDDDGHVPFGIETVRIRVMIPSQESGELTISVRPVARFCLRSGFGEQCSAMHNKGVKFDLITETPGEFYARFADPDGNRFELWSPIGKRDEIGSLRNSAAYKRY